MEPCDFFVPTFYDVVAFRQKPDGNQRSTPFSFELETYLGKIFLDDNRLRGSKPGAFENQTQVAAFESGLESRFFRGSNFIALR